MGGKCFEYFLNAVFYQMCLGKKNIDVFIRKLVTAPFEMLFNIIYSLVRKVFSKHDFTNYDERRLNGKEAFYELFDSPEYNYSSTERWFQLFILLYFSMLIPLLMGIIFRLTYNMIVAVVIIIPAILYASIILRKAVFNDDRYVIYYNVFKKKDRNWRRKWKWITFGFIIGGLIAPFAGIFIFKLLLS